MPGLPVAALGEPPQQLHVELASYAGAVMVAVDIATGLSRPLESGHALQSLPIRKADDLFISLEYEPFVGGAEPIDARSHLIESRDVELQRTAAAAGLQTASLDEVLRITAV
jgi:hypothetical protein